MSGDFPEAKLTSLKVTKFRPDSPEKKAPPRMVLVQGDAEEASILTKASRLRRDLTAWAKAGLPLASKALRNARLATCNACPGGYFDPAGNWGLGQCKAPGCGCSKIKAALATSKCPKSYWSA
jgi:hypothetical protein